MTEPTKSGGRGKQGGKGMVLAVVAIIAFAAFTGINIHKAKRAETAGVKKEKSVPVALFKARFMTFDQVLDLTGEIRPRRDVLVLPKVPGRVIESVLPQKGDLMEKGDLVAVLDASDVRVRMEAADAGLAAARAGLRKAEASLAVLEKDRLRLESLLREKAVARQKLDHLVGQVEMAREMRKAAAARIGQAEAVCRQLAIVYKDHRVIAPENGVVAARFVDSGNLSAPSKPIIRLADETTVKVVTFVAEKDFPFVKKGMAAEVRVDAYPDVVFAGSICIVNPVFNPATRNFDVEIHIPNPGARLRSGMFARVRLHLGKRTVTVVERDAVLRTAGTGNDYLFAVVDGRAVLKNVATGAAQGRFVEIVSGIGPGKPVIVTGHGTLRDGDRVAAKGGTAP